MSSSQEAPEPKGHLTESIFIFFALGGFTGLSWVLHDLYNNGQYQRSKEEIEKLFSQAPKIVFNADSLNNPSPESQNTIDVQVTVYRFNRKTDSLNQAFYEAVIRSNTENTVKELRQITTEHLVDGLTLINLLTKEKNAQLVDNTQGLVIKLDDKTYDLAKPVQFQALFGLTTLRLEGLSFDADINKATDSNRKDELLRKKAQNHLTQELLVWLVKNETRVGLRDDGLLLANPQSLAGFARALQTVTEFGYENPLLAFSGPQKDSQGRMSHKNSVISTNAIVDYLDPYGSVDSLVHLLAYHLSTKATEQKTGFSLESFESFIKDTEQKNLSNVKDMNNLVFTNPPRTDKFYRYAEFFTEYILRGDLLRGKIRQLEKDDPSAATILWREYDFFEKVFRGKQFTNGGVVYKEVDAKVAELVQQEEARKKAEEEKTKPPQPEKAKEIGQKFSIMDKDTDRPGIFLRNSPGSNTIYLDSPAVFNGDTVEIIGGPFITKRGGFNSQTGEYEYVDVKWWEVKITSQGQLGAQSVGLKIGATGYIDEKWLSANKNP